MDHEDIEAQQTSPVFRERTQHAADPAGRRRLSGISYCMHCSGDAGPSAGIHPAIGNGTSAAPSGCFSMRPPSPPSEKENINF